MKMSVLGQAGGSDPQHQEGAGKKQFVNKPSTDPAENEMRMLSRVERLEQWALAKQASKDCQSSRD